MWIDVIILAAYQSHQQIGLAAQIAKVNKLDPMCRLDTPGGISKILLNARGYYDHCSLR